MKNRLLFCKFATFTLFTVIALPCLPQSARAQTPTPLASWNFSTGTPADLVSDIGGYTLTPRYGNTPLYAAGSIGIDQYTGLYATEINSTAFPSMTSNATIFTRMRFDGSVGGGGGLFFFGLVNETNLTGPQGYNEMAMTTWDPNGAKISIYGNTSSNSPGGIYPGTVAVPTIGQYFTLGISVVAGFNGLGAVDPSQTLYNFYFNGTWGGSLALTGSAMSNFQSLAFGQIFVSGGVAPMTLSTLQVYNSTLTDSQITALDAAAVVPEPATFASFAAGLGALLLLGRRVRNRGTI